MTTLSHQHHHNHAILALDVGGKRVGVAIARQGARLPLVLTTLDRDADIMRALQDIVAEEGVGAIVVGLPRSLSGEVTAQTAATEAFAAELRNALGLPLHWQDEAVTSRQAEAELRARGKPYKKGDIDALSATYILEDYLRDNPETKI
jgi:putative Holliday junction resolvase